MPGMCAGAVHLCRVTVALPSASYKPPRSVNGERFRLRAAVHPWDRAWMGWADDDDDGDDVDDAARLAEQQLHKMYVASLKQRSCGAADAAAGGARA